MTLTNPIPLFDGPAIREVELWKAIHTDYWNAQLAQCGLKVSDDMPVYVERFELLYSDLS